jgi:dipeptidyl aminopeptidase/acylaminoacyl peptidase
MPSAVLLYVKKGNYCMLMIKKNLVFVSLMLCIVTTAQQKLTIERIMGDPKWIGSSPSNPYWSFDGNYLFFDWNPDNSASDSLYYITITDKKPRKADAAMKKNILPAVVYNNAYTQYVYSKDGDIFFTDTRSNKTKQITQTTDAESNPQFSFNETKVVYTLNQNLYAWDIADGTTIQLTNFQKGTAPIVADKKEQLSEQEKWLKDDQLKNFDVLRTRKAQKDAKDSMNKLLPKNRELKAIYTDDKVLNGISISPDGKFITYRLIKNPVGTKTTIVADYVTESGFTIELNGRGKVGALTRKTESYIYNRQTDSVIPVKTDQLPGIKDLPDYVRDYPKQLEERIKKNADRNVIITRIIWSPRGINAVLDIRSQDNKDRWLMALDTATMKLKLLDRQRDEAWIGGPGIGGSYGGGNDGWLDETTFWFQSEATGYSHLYTSNIMTGEKKALTSGNYEVQDASLSHDKKYFYITTNEVHPGEKQFYRLPVAGGKAERITTMTGANEITLSPTEKNIAILYSYSNKPWEMYWQENKPAVKAEQVTFKAQSDEFRSYTWRDPELITFKASDGATVYARLYKPATPNPLKPAVIFVHGAGYLQNAHKWWSQYFHEYMFHNLLADNGYYVLDIDYRGSAGYGRDWRTGIYRHMGGRDLSDQLDGKKYLVDNFGTDPKRVGIYGGSYGGFLTLMAMFTAPDAFAAGAALRPVTDWANYNNGYTSDILNEPYNDSIAYHRSSPYYFADGLKGHLLICHGMVDLNVNFQDAVKLSQRLIELGKDNWELASYPMEDHDFMEPSSWTDEYKRIFKLFETVLK